MPVWRIFLGALFLAMWPAASLTAYNEDGLVELSDKNECADVTMAYPYFGIQRLDNGVSGWAESYFKTLVEDLKQYCLEDPEFREKSAGWASSVTAAGLTSTPGTVSITFSVNSYSGGARPRQGVKTLVLDMDGKRLCYEDLFDQTEGLWELLSRSAQAALRPAPGEALDLDGLAPKADSFKHFLVTPEGLTLIFPEYDEQLCNVPLAALARFKPKPGLWDNPKAVKPSFDCAKAANRAEAGICASPLLAYYEAEMAREYARVMEVADKEALKNEQNQWRQAMESQCGSGSALCLLKHYITRLAKLREIEAWL